MYFTVFVCLFGTGYSVSLIKLLRLSVVHLNRLCVAYVCVIDLLNSHLYPSLPYSPPLIVSLLPRA